MGTISNADRGAGLRIAILAENDRTFLLPVVERTIRRLREGAFRVTHLGIVPPRLGRFHGWQVPLWYFRIFGARNAALLALFSALEACRRFRGHYGARQLSLSWRGLAKKFGLSGLRFLVNPNHHEAIEFLRGSQCDVLLVMVPYVLGPEVLAVPKIGVINKHAAILPGCRGLFPYVWSTILAMPLGVTFHKVISKIDAGPVLLQRRVDPDSPPNSMFEFYVWVFHQFPEMALEAVRKLCSLTVQQNPECSPGDYFSLPSAEDYDRFRRARGRVARLRDLRHSLVR